MDTLETLTTLIVQKLGQKPEGLRPDSKLAELGIDSLSMLEFTFELEEHFNVEIPQDAAASVATLQDLANLIDRLVSAKERVDASEKHG